MAQKCVHKGCGKVFTDENESCTYHQGAPEFHEGQKGWKCCKPRVLTFDEFLTIPPCTTGKHSTVDETLVPNLKPTVPDKSESPPSKSISQPTAAAVSGARQPNISQSQVPQAAAAPESDSDEPCASLPSNTTCKRRGCGTSSSSCSSSRENEECIYHSGQALFHEGSKGWTCCKRRVLEFDEFMKIAGCKTRPRHCFVGKKRREAATGEEELEKLSIVRNDFYQTSSMVQASIYLKKINKETSKVEFAASGTEMNLDLQTTDGKQYEASVPLYGKIDPGKSSFRVLGTKLELSLAKIDGLGWPVLRSDEKLTGEIIQIGRAGRT